MKRTSVTGHVPSRDRQQSNMADPMAAEPTQFSGGSAPASVVIACSYDPLGLQAPLQVWLQRLTGQRCALHWVAYGMLMDVLRDRTSVWGTNGDLNVLLLRWQDLSRSQIRGGAAELVAAVRSSSMARRGPTLVLLPPSVGRSADGDVESVVDEIPAEALCTQLSAIDGVTVLEPEHLRRVLEASTELTWHSPFLDRIAHAPYSPAANSVLASIICRALHRTGAPPRKVYCLDCDNTLWGGAVSELGPRGVELSEAYLSVQRLFVARQARGALLCLISRNDVADVLSVLRERASELVLREHHVVAIRASQEMHKGAALMELANHLCLDPTSFVFVDDSPRECADVHAACAHHGVGIVQIPRDPLAIPSWLGACWGVDEPLGVSRLTAEDEARTLLYRQLNERKTFVASSRAAAACSMDAFAASLNLRVDITPLDVTNARRAAQATKVACNG